jgi:glycosyltransferase involved in cell wall biosynthesis
MQFGFLKCVTTSEFQKEYLSNVMRNISYDILTPYISDNFTKPQLPPKPIIAINSRDQRDTANIIKSFYLKFPQYRWVSFRDMRGLSEKEFAKTLQDCFLSVWIDETSGYGTYPLESMKSGVPVLGLVPNVFPHWMNENNGFWINNKSQTVDFIADILQNWLEDNLKSELFSEMDKTVESLPTKESFESSAIELFEGYIQIRQQSFEEQLNKLVETETIQ